jgi:hypothetical protein
MTAPRATARGQPGVGLAGIALVVPVALILSVGLGSPERSLVVFAPLSTFAFPVVVMIAFWWDDWPGTILRAPSLGISDTLLVLAGAVGLTIADQALIAHVDLAVFIAMLQPARLASCGGQG